MGRLERKAAIVTGAGRGIGRGVALTFAREGARVMVASRTAATVDEVVGQIRSSGGTAIGLCCDVGRHDQLKDMVARTVDAFGGVDILVNNAQGFGTEASPTGTPAITPFEDFPEEEWEYTMRTGPLATLRAMQAVFPYMKERGGKIINFGSRRGQIGYAGTLAYNSAKEAIRALSRTAAREWGQYGVNVNVINPLVMSHSLETFRDQYAGQASDALKDVPMRRYGDPERDAGPLAVFLASADSDYITGMTFMLDGGFFMTP
ncbi:MAG: SDR family oxidoreductase [Caulobacteraceae bacterium]|nr:SDR family oxidoreductase [Caulobacteraceae bacterium]